MPAVAKKNKVKSLKKAPSATKEKKFISGSLQKQKARSGLHKKRTPKHRRRGVLYIKHLPHGFYEDELRGYFSQFGAITRLRLARSPKTLGSKGYAFIEFRYPEVAEIAAEAMNNYIMFKNIIKTRFIPPGDIKHDYFRSGVKKVSKDGVKVLTSKSIEARETVVKNTNKLLTTEDEKKRTDVIASKVQKQKQKLAALGIDFDLDEVTGNMGEEFMKTVESKKPKTIENLNLESDEESDESFDPSQLEIDSDEDFEDFEYDSEHSDDDDGIDVNIDSLKLENAIKVAREASKKAAEVPPTKSSEKKEKEIKGTVSAKKAKGAKNDKENEVVSEPKVVTKNVKAPAKKNVPAAPSVSKKSLKRKTPVDEDLQASPVEKLTNRAIKKSTELPGKGKQAAKEKPALKEKKPAAKKISKPESELSSISTSSKPTRTRKIPAKFDNAASEDDLPPPKGKKAKKIGSLNPVQAEKKSTRAKKPVASPLESPVPAKTKKLAKASTGIEKKKPIKADKKLKLAANVATSSEDFSEIVKLVKGNEIKGKKKAGSKK